MERKVPCWIQGQFLVFSVWKSLGFGGEGRKLTLPLPLTQCMIWEYCSLFWASSVRWWWPLLLHWFVAKMKCGRHCESRTFSKIRWLKKEPDQLVWCCGYIWNQTGLGLETKLLICLDVYRVLRMDSAVWQILSRIYLLLLLLLSFLWWWWHWFSQIRSSKSKHMSLTRWHFNVSFEEINKKNWRISKLIFRNVFYLTPT